MPVIEKYSQGSPCWFELGTTDQAGAKTFYTGLFGWSAADSPMGPDTFYTMMRLNGHSLGGAYTLDAEMRNQGVPPHWMVYFAVDDADASAAKVTELGGALICAPFDVRTYGRMATCKDPTGAVFSIWQPKDHKGAGVFGDRNVVGWAELATRDLAGAEAFYKALLGWQTKQSATSPAHYVEFGPGPQPMGGLLQMDAQWEGIPPHWGIYFMVDDCDAKAARITGLGGAVRFGPFDAPGVGRIAIVADPQGANFSIITLALPPHGDGH
jgi:hypothetical protein